jgi:hypothetical protein
MFMYKFLTPLFCFPLKESLTTLNLPLQNVPHRSDSRWGGSADFIFEGGTMDYQTRNKFEHYCALAEIEEDADKFAEISRNIARLLEEKQTMLIKQRPFGKVPHRATSSNVA